ncbi:MAG: hypothetical protein ACREF5_02500 [Candidatus Saccharimonadales bacterium]
MDELSKDTDSETSSLEEPTTVVEMAQSGANSSSTKPLDSDTVSTPNPESPQISPPPSGIKNHIKRFFKRFNIYLLLFIFLLIIAVVISIVFYLKAQNASSGNTPLSQSLTQSELSQLSNSDVSVGEPQHTLNVQSNAVFTGSVLVRSNLQIAGTLQVGSASTNNGIRVTGNSTFDNVQITQSLALTGNGSIQGQLNVQKGLDVNGTGTFEGAISAPQITVSSLELSGDLILTHHIDAGGATPTRTYGSALGSGGSASVNGSDTAGSVTINTGSNPVAGCFVTINFATAFNSTPHIVITPVGLASAGLAYYINRATTNFSICTSNVPSSGASFGFDYIAFD